MTTIPEPAIKHNFRRIYRINKYHKAFNHSTPRKRVGWSIDCVSPNGNYICQEAFWFRTREEAATRLSEIIIEDAADGCESREYKEGDDWTWT